MQSRHPLRSSRLATTFPIAGCLVLCICVGNLFAEKPNVLFIAVDDLRPQLGCYGKQQMHTPNIDRMASRGVLFERAYCMVPTCGASRASLLTGIRPTPNRFVNYLTWAEKDAPSVVPLNTHFQAQGYKTISLGKIYHHSEDHSSGWSEKPWRSKNSSYQNTERAKAGTRSNRQKWPSKKKHRSWPFENFDVPDDDYPDGDCTARAIDYLQKFAPDSDQPFFLAVGYLKPHLPFNAPQKYWDLYDAEAIKLPDNYAAPKDAPAIAMHNSGELRAYAGIHPKHPVDAEMARSLIHGYYACTSFTDANVGRLLKALDETGLSESTTVVLWGDHGWQLGEHGMWNKHSCFETSMHAPLLIVPPKNAETRIAPGKRVEELVEFIDIYPTLCELSGIQAPAHLEGSSMVPLMRGNSSEWKQFAVGRYRTGDTIRSADYRYSQFTTKSGEVTGEMLFDHEADPHENSNVAVQNRKKVEALAEQLEKRKGS